MRLFVTLSLILTSSLLSAQFHDNHWMMGYEGGEFSPPNDSFGVSVLSFYNADLKITDNQEIDLCFDSSSSSFSNYNGSLLFYSNNKEIRDINDQLIFNGHLENNGFTEQVSPQSFIYLPFDEGQLIQYVYTTYSNDFPSYSDNINLSVISDQDGVLGIFSETEDLTADSLSTGNLTACRHANGEDWWILAALADNPIVYSLLFTPSGVQSTDTLSVTNNMKNGLGQAVFSPNGENYIQLNLVNLNEPGYLDIFDFNRATGELSNQQRTTLSLNAFAGGVAVSPSSQYLYVADYETILQYDLWAEDVLSSVDTVAVYDGFLESGFFPTRFYLAQLAPDGKIYINSPSGVRSLHVIEFPDKKGVACNVRQHAIQLPNFNSFTLANHPNYRLGSIDGSPADSLGIDNLPRAYYRTDRNTEDTLGFHFQDLSFYEPATWSWSFGDGSDSSERHPDHTFAGPGIYEVCLTVTNDLGTDTECRTLELGPSAVTDLRPLDITTFPNPVRDVLVFDLGDYFPLNGRFKLVDGAGREVLSEQVLNRQTTFNLAHLSAGMYYYSFWDGGVRLGTGKVVVE